MALSWHSLKPSPVLLDNFRYSLPNLSLLKAFRGSFGLKLAQTLAQISAAQIVVSLMPQEIGRWSPLLYCPHGVDAVMEMARSILDDVWAAHLPMRIQVVGKGVSQEPHVTPSLEKDADLESFQQLQNLVA